MLHFEHAQAGWLLDGVDDPAATRIFIKGFDPKRYTFPKSPPSILTLTLFACGVPVHPSALYCSPVVYPVHQIRNLYTLYSKL